MNRYRIIQYANGSYGVQCKRWFLGFWRTLPFQTDFKNGAKMQIVDMQAKDIENVNIKKGLKVAKVLSLDD